ncbi:restriction endonuclease subunit S [Peptostreptococcus anaerobius]|uniref:Restriction endonuclease subunit S n=1 Tax=Peptostreptococcus porci TaxID=2652282 RepID=A0A6N7XDH7_9FIRM|nr:restriction endonuclease subunit S [Peptostreptococcus porci]MST61603.1 restriction endonuclease subunit S [Peptostreptococcus porci]
MNDMKKPSIRFKGFTEDWEQRKLGDMMNVTSVKRIHQSDWTDYGIRFLRARDIVSAYKNEEPDDYLYISKEKYDEYSSISGKVSIGDMLVTGVGTIGVPYLVDNSDPLYFKDGNIIWFQNEDKVFGKFLFYSFAGKSIQDFITESAGIGTVGTYTIESGKKTPISLPDKEEQERIGLFFANLDYLITLHQRKYDKLVNVKKSMLEKMFPREGKNIPEIRFSGFTETWEQRKLGEIVGIYDGVHQTPKYQDGGIMFLSVENIATLQSSKYISEDDFKRDYKVYPQENDILMTRIGDVGTTNVITDNSLKAYYVSLALLKYKSTNPYFLSNAIQSDYVKNGLANRTLKTAIPMKINKDEIGKVDVMLPTSVKEQTKIGTYFRNLDHLITLHQREVEKLKNIKKSCLEKMFV